MKPDGVTMETMEPTEAAAGAEPSLSQGAATQDEVTEQTPSPSQPEETADAAAPPAAQEANGKPAAADSKAKPKALVSKTKPAAKTTGASGHNSRPGTVLNRAVNGVKPTTNAPAKAAPVKKTTTTTGASATGAVPKRAVPPSTARTQTKVPEKKPVGPARTTAAAAMVTNGTKPASSTLKKPPTRPVNGSRPKTTAPASRPAASTASKPSTSTTAKADTTAKTTRPTTAPSTSRPASTTSRPTTAGARPTTTATIKPSTTGTGKPATFRATAAPSAGRTTAAQPLKNTAAAKKDVSRPASATAMKKPTPATTLGATKKPEPSKPTATAKPESKKPVPTNAADLKQTRPRTQEPQKSAPTKKATSPAARFPGVKLPQGRNPPFSPANKPAASPAPAKRVPKPTQAVPPFTAAKKPGVKNSTNTARAPSSAAATAAAATAAVAAAVATAAVIVTEPTNLPAETQVEDEVALPEGSSCAASAQEEVPSLALAQDTPSEVVPQEAALGNAAAPSLPQSPVTAASPPTSAPYDLVESTAPSLTNEEQISVSVEAALPPMGEEAPPELSEEPVHLMLDQTLPISPSKPSPPAANGAHQVVSPSNLNEEEDEEEREGSQQVSVSEMSGTTQPTEESRPGSAGPVGGSAWRAGGALFSELDSEEVSGSQQGASELSAPGVLEGTESMDDLGDASLKGAIDMEGASAGSPDFEKVPDIPVNDFEEDEDDYDDRVCDMDVGSERADDLRRPRYDNEVDEEEEDEDVDMASEGVTESGLESYGNADEDDFAEDERLDNLNRVAQPPPPPLLPSAPAAQWDQPNPFADPWAQSLQPLQPQQPLEHVSQPLQAAAVVPASPSTDLWQADSETPTQSPAQPWLELGCASFVAQNQEVSCHSSVQGEASKPEAQSCMDQSSLAPLQTLAPAPLSATGMSLSSTLSSDTSTPEELCDYNREGKLQIDTPVLSLQPNPVDEDLGIHLEGEDGESEKEAEAETLPADEVLGGPATAPTSNPSSSSTTEDEASDTEGEAQLEDSLDTQGLQNITFECQPPAQRCLSALEEGEEEDVEGGVREDSTPPSANSAASYGFDTSTTASNSNAASTGESCTKSPGIFSLEELPEEAKEPCLLEEPPTQPCPAEQHYMQCGKQEAEPAEDAGVEVSGSEEAPHAPSSTLTTREQREDDSDDPQPPYYAICEKTENSFAGFGTLWHAHRRDHPPYPRPYCDVIKPHCGATVVPPRLSCADLPPRRSPGQQALSPQLRKLEQHQRQLLEMQQRREQQSRPMEEVEQERKSRAEEEQRKKREEAEEEIKKNKEEEQRKVREHAEEMKREEENRRKEEVKHREQQRRDLQLQLQQQQQELKQRQQIMQWQKELEEQQSTVLLSPSSGLCTIYEALENSDEEEEEGMKEVDSVTEQEEAGEEALSQVMDDHQEQVTSDSDKDRDSSSSTLSPPPLPDSPQRLAHPQHPDVDSPPRDDDDSSTPPMESPERPPPLDLDWGKKVDIVQQLINQTLLLTGDGCSSLLLLPGGGGGTLSPLESSLWPSLLPPLTPPSATVTSVSSFSPEAPGSSPQGEWTVVELETHH